MTLCFFLKIISECSIYYFVGNWFYSLGNSGIPSFLPMIITAAVGAASYWLDAKFPKKPKLRFLPLPFLALVIPSAFSAATLAMVLIPAVYVIFAVKTRRFYMDHGIQVDFFGNCTKVIGLLCFPILLTAVMLHQLSMEAPFAVCFVVSNILLLRMLRHSPEVMAERRFRILNFGSIGLTGLIIFLLCSPWGLRMMTAIGKWLYTTIIIPPLVLVCYIVVFAVGILAKIFFFLFRNYDTPANPYNNQMNFGGEMDMEKLQGLNPEGSPMAVMLIQGAIILIAVIAACIFFYRMARKNKATRPTSRLGETRSAVTYVRPKEEKPPADRFPPREPRQAVRYYYRCFLRLCLQLGYHLEPSDDSAGIQKEMSGRLDPEKLTSLRQTYIRARYSEHTVTSDDVAAAKASYQSMKSSAAEMQKNLQAKTR